MNKDALVWLQMCVVSPIEVGDRVVIGAGVLMTKPDKTKSSLCSRGISKLMQIGDEFIIIIIAAAASYICGKGYIFLWSKKIELTTTPSGFGVLLPVFVLTFMALILEGWATSLNGILIIFIASIIYWLDDLVELLRFTRILLAFCCGVALVLVASPEQLFTALELVVFSIACGVFSFGITQVINFADGADLNLAVMVF